MSGWGQTIRVDMIKKRRKKKADYEVCGAITPITWLRGLSLLQESR